jgi:hypothetical protein
MRLPVPPRGPRAKLCSVPRRVKAPPFRAFRVAASLGISRPQTELLEGVLDKLVILTFLIVATTVEASGDAIVRMV